MLGHQTQPPNAKGPLLDIRGARNDTQRIVAEYDVRTPSIEVLASALSGRKSAEVDRRARDERNPGGVRRCSPDARRRRGGSGSDLGPHCATRAVKGLAVLLVSADLDELIGLSDTIKVMLRGKIVAEVDPATVTPEDLGSAMTGAGRAADVRSDSACARS